MNSLQDNGYVTALEVEDNQTVRAGNVLFRIDDRDYRAKQRLTATAAMLAGKGMDQAAAARAATSLLGKAVSGQARVIAFDSAFFAVALLFVFAAPMLVAIKIGLGRYAKAHATHTVA
ncbi:hypothetical protein PS914_05021 [Pseudomonas fluorescens]|uniref:biotin/lipoyl-binding protein n=1 Tax=Pseudomonas fluorescens TaxID=294 RepID=UPI00125911D3|nr:hypothetical protein PS914_05021 [Pseudomonas fluorescens]